MIQATVDRLLPLASETDFLVVTGETHIEEVALQLPGMTREQFIVEPAPRGSGPAIGLATAIVARRDPEAVVGSFAADHVVERPAAFQEAVRRGIEAATQGYLVTIGIQPTYPETGYGYIRSGEPLGGDAAGAFTAREFKEKPDLATATHYVANGNYLWNASMFVWQARTLMDEMRRLLPDLATAVETIADAWDTPARAETLERIWPTMEDITIDHGILEHSERVAVVPADLGWADLGDWHGFGTVLAGGTGEAVVNCELLVEDASGTVAIGNGRLIAVLGIDNLVVVDTDDALLICERTRAQDVRKLVDELRRRGSTHLI